MIYLKGSDMLISSILKERVKYFTVVHEPEIKILGLYKRKQLQLLVPGRCTFQRKYLHMYLFT